MSKSVFRRANQSVESEFGKDYILRADERFFLCKHKQMHMSGNPHFELWVRLKDGTCSHAGLPTFATLQEAKEFFRNQDGLKTVLNEWSLAAFLESNATSNQQK